MPVRKPIELRDLKKLARRVEIDLTKVVGWHTHYASWHVKKSTGRGYIERPAGMVSMGDATRKYEISGSMLRQWRAQGLAAKSTMGLVLLNEQELKKWIKINVFATQKGKR